MAENITIKKKARRRPGAGYPSFNKRYVSLRDFQIQKRKELKAMKGAFAKAQMGIAYVPGYAKHWDKLSMHLNAMIESAKPRNWK